MYIDLGIFSTEEVTNFSLLYLFAVLWSRINFMQIRRLRLLLYCMMRLLAAQAPQHCLFDTRFSQDILIILIHYCKDAIVGTLLQYGCLVWVYTVCCMSCVYPDKSTIALTINQIACNCFTM
jgi:hypothetical protein